MQPPYNPSFSQRFGHRDPEVEITIREDAPEVLREAVVMLTLNSGLDPSTARQVVCGVLLKAPNRDNWSASNVSDEVQRLVENAPWYRVYDIAETFYRYAEQSTEDQGASFQDRLNEVFLTNGIGWWMEQGQIVARGSEAFNVATSEAAAVLGGSGRHTAAGELHEALRDISRRPVADKTGAIQHSMAALECVARDVTGKLGKTLGGLVEDLRLPKPLDTALEKLWGYTSEVGRHLREGREPGFEEAELVVTLACGLSIYLARSGKVSTM